MTADVAAVVAALRRYAAQVRPTAATSAEAEWFGPVALRFAAAGIGAIHGDRERGRRADAAESLAADVERIAGGSDGGLAGMTASALAADPRRPWVLLPIGQRLRWSGDEVELEVAR